MITLKSRKCYAFCGTGNYITRVKYIYIFLI